MGRQSNTVKAPYVFVGVNGLLCREPSVGLVVPGGPDLGAAYEWQDYSFYLVQWRAIEITMLLKMLLYVLSV